ncbi:MAG: glycoside hydrolase family 9 protein [Pedobacter sp.]|nr:glycoside hydrolase family 9 protein [Chitinophagaceae bacterium]
MKQLLQKMPKAVYTVIGCLLLNTSIFSQKLQLNDSTYFETRGVNVLVYNNQYTGIFLDEKTAGIELIHHGVRTSTGGAVRLQNTPEQWDLVPSVISRKVDKATKSIDVVLRYKEYDFESKIHVIAKGDGVEISVYLDKAVPEKLIGKAGFNLEFLPSSYFEKTYLADGKSGNFPLYPTSTSTIEPISNKIPQFLGYTTFDDRGKGQYIVPLALAIAKTLVLAPEDAERRVKIQSQDADLQLFDGRILAQNGWFVVRSLLPAQKTGKVLTWYVEPNAVPNWKREPVIEFSQVGYHPSQEKIAVIELDKNDTPLTTAALFKVTADGKYIETLKGDTKVWGQYLRYNYVKFDFSTVKESGVYYIQYGNQKTNTFSIGTDVYANTWHPTLDVWFPVQMDHMQVNEAYRVWHGAPFLDDALQAPVNFQHFDNYMMGPTTDTKYKPGERIPGLAVGGWFDAGDFDIETNSHNVAITNFVHAWENFKLTRDETYIDQVTRYTDIHRPDGKPDLLQQIEHGTLNLVAQMKNIGHPARGIIVPNLHQYHHLGDAVNETDNLPYNPNLKPYESDGKSSGTKDDRWAFTTRNTFLDYQTVATLAAASRALKGYNVTLAKQSLLYAQQLWLEDDTIKQSTDTARFGSAIRRGNELSAPLQLYISTKDERYSKRFTESLWQILDKSLAFGIMPALQAYPFMDKVYQARLRDYVVKYKAICDDYAKQNPYGVPMALRGWGNNGNVINWAITNFYAHKFYPDIFSTEYVFKGLNYLYGCHPYSNISFVSSVGTKSKKVTYGNNRANFSFIAGGVVPGLILLKPDFPENKEDWPFFWGENEVTISTCAPYIFLSAAASELLKNK